MSAEKDSSDTQARYQSFADFWPAYLREHSAEATRKLHFLGTSLATLCLLLALVTWNAWWLLGAPIAGYAFAWIAHAFVERNRPMTFTYPLWSLAGDYLMTWRWLTGGLEKDLRRAGLDGDR